MKKIIVYSLIFIFAQNAALATTFGTYKPEYEYGLLDGIKFNLFNKKRNEGIIQVKDDVDKKLERTKATKEEQDRKDDEEYQMYKFMLDNTVAF